MTAAAAKRVLQTKIVDAQGATACALRAAAHAYHAASEETKPDAERALYAAALEFAGLALIRVGEDHKHGGNR